MPIYTYRCKKCKYDFEELKRVREDMGSALCPKCGGKAQITEDYMAQGVTFRFKGPGFYENDYRVK
jgi:putative FmdB family regulatory protein